MTELAVDATPFDEILTARLESLELYRQAEAAKPADDDTSTEARHARINFEDSKEAYEARTHEASVLIDTVGGDSIGAAERLLARQVYIHSRNLEDPIAELRHRYGVISQIRTVLSRGGLGVALAADKITLYKDVTDAALQQTRALRPGYENMHRTGEPQIVVKLEKGTGISAVHKALPEYYTAHNAEQTEVVLHQASRWKLSPFRNAEAWLETQQAGTNPLLLLGKGNELQLPPNLQLTDVQRYLFRIGMAEHARQVKLAIPKPEGTDFRDMVTETIARAFAKIVAESTPTKPRQRSVVIPRVRGSWPAPLPGEIKKTPYPVHITDYDAPRLRRVLAAAGVSQDAVADATREKVARLYTRPTMTQMMESINAKRNIETFLQAIFA